MDSMAGVLVGEVLGLRSKEAIREAMIRELEDGDSEDSVLDDYCKVPDTNTGYPKSLSGSLKSLLDNGKADLGGGINVRMPVKGFNKASSQSALALDQTDLNPYDVMLVHSVVLVDLLLLTSTP